MEKIGKVISLQTVLETTPAESKAESKVISSIEHHDEEQGDLVDVDNAHVFESPVEDRAEIEEELYNLTKKMKKAKSGIHKESSCPSKSKQGKSAAKGEDEPTLRESHDGFFTKNAERLVTRARLGERLVAGETRETFEQAKRFLAERHLSAWQFIKAGLVYWVLPFLGLASLLHHSVGNPKDPDKASSSWWILFVLVRQPLVLGLAKLTEAFVVDLCCVHTKISMRLFGPLLTLTFMQSKGWPFQLTCWGVCDLFLLYGDNAFVRHWAYSQDLFEVFTRENHAGHVTEVEVWLRILICAILGGVLVAMKRVSLGLWYSRAVYRRYGQDLSRLLQRAVLISDLAATDTSGISLSATSFDTAIFREASIEEEKGGRTEPEDESVDEASTNLLVDPGKRSFYTGGLSLSQKLNIHKLLGEWEEPISEEKKAGEHVPIRAVVQFQAAFSCIDRKYPFTSSFGLADKRENCILSAQKLFSRLTKTEENKDVIRFETIAALAVGADGNLDRAKLTLLVHIFRPARNGELTLLEFVKSIDTVYKDLRVIRASILNARKMNAASQHLVDVFFSLILVLIALAILGINGLALIGGMLGFVVSFAFMIGGASSKYFEGLLLVLVRKPYTVGDRVAVSDVNDEVSDQGSSGWIVKDVDLFKTTVVFGASGEEATYSNGSLAASRIINHNRSPKAVLYFLARFGIDVDKEKVTRFGKAVEQFVKDRPREFLSFVAFRLSAVQPDLGFVEYKIIMQHRESWQQIGALLTSKAGVQLYAYELSKEMKMGYENPAMPIILTSRDSDEQSGETGTATEHIPGVF